jgi:hypothetical protein
VQNRPARRSNPAQRQGDFAHAVNPSDRLLPESTLDFVLIATPVSRQQTVLHIAMEATVRPIANPSDITVLHRIEVKVIDVTLKVRIVSDCVLPKPSLPDPRFAPLYLAPRPQLRRRQLAGESAFDLAPASREIGLAGRQGPNGMEMVWQDADGIRCERQARLNRTINLP